MSRQENGFNDGPSNITQLMDTFVMMDDDSEDTASIRSNNSRVVLQPPWLGGNQRPQGDIQANFPPNAHANGAPPPYESLPPQHPRAAHPSSLRTRHRPKARAQTQNPLPGYDDPDNAHGARVGLGVRISETEPHDGNDSGRDDTVPLEKVHVKFKERSMSEPTADSSPGMGRGLAARMRTTTGWRRPAAFRWGSANPGGGHGHRRTASGRRISRQLSRTASRMRQMSERTFSTVGVDDENQERGTWSNQFEFFLSCLGYAVGLGNVWRFPYLCHENGGGAFLIPYMLCLIFCGIPMLLLELSLGQYSSEGPLSIWKISPLFRGTGVGMVLISLFLAAYYNMITGWAIYYLYASITTELPWTCCDPEWAGPNCVSFSSSCPENQLNSSTYSNLTTSGPNPSVIPSNGPSFSNLTFLANYTEMEISDGAANFTFAAFDYFHHVALDISPSIDELGGVKWHLFAALTAAWLIVFLVLMRGIKSVGKIVYFTSLFPYVVLSILLIRACMEPGAIKGVIYYLTPKWSKLLEAKVWGEALTQIFFSTSICTGGVITLASYNKFHNNVYRDALMIGVGNSLTSIYSGFVVFSILGFMAERQGAEVKDIVEGGPGLTFIIYPQAVTLLPASPIWSALFFSMLITLALSSMFPTVENITTAVIDQFPNILRPYKLWITLLTCALLFGVGCTMATSGGVYVLLMLDKYAVGYALVIVGLAEIIVFAWVYGSERILKNIEAMVGFRPSIIWHYLWRYICPTLLVVSLVFTWIDYKPLEYGGKRYPMWADGLGWFLSFLPLIAIIIFGIYVYATYSTHMAWSHGQGSCWQIMSTKLRELMRTDPTWGPALSKYRNSVTMQDISEHDDEVFG